MRCDVGQSVVAVVALVVACGGSPEGPALFSVTTAANPPAGGAASGGGSYASGTSVTVTATPAAGYRFDNWTEDTARVSADSAYTFDVTANRSLVANFVQRTNSLEVSASGLGSGTVTSSPAGINCSVTTGITSGSCDANFAEGITVTLTATPVDSNHTFAGWSGDCTGTDICTVSMTQPSSVTVRFNVKRYPLVVSGGGTGSGTVGSSPAGINCTITAGTASGTCMVNYSASISVSLIASPANGGTFTGWSGDCTGTGICTVSMAQPRNVTANFASAAASAPEPRAPAPRAPPIGTAAPARAPSAVASTVGSVAPGARTRSRAVRAAPG